MKEHLNNTRIIIDTLLVLAVAFAPFYVVLVILLAGLYFVPRWWEIIFCGIILDLLYHGGDGAYFVGESAILFSTTMIFALGFLLSEVLRAVLREHAR